MMDAARWEEVQSLFHQAAALPRAEQQAWLEANCTDQSLVAEVLQLLEEDARDSLLDHGVGHSAREVLGDTRDIELGEFGAYRIMQVLGEGGMGVVYLAERADLGSRAAIKILRDAWLSPARRDRFIAEQRTLAQLNHPSIARLYDAGTLPDGTPWFVMEYVDGVPITEFCRTRASTVPERLRLFRAVCEAVLHAHRHLVIHRDLKPSNVMVQNDGSVKLLDFGIAKQLDSLDAPLDHTRTSVRLMTPAYAAPEQVRGERIGLHTDVYTLGVLLFELLVGRLPFDFTNKSSTAVDEIILQQDPEKPSVVATRVAASSASGTSHIRATSRQQWADLDVLCLTAMQKDPQRRYATVEALIRDVDHYLSGEPLEAQPDSARYRMRKFMTRNWRILSVAALIVLLVTGLVGFYTVRLRAARNKAIAEATRTQRIQRFTLDLFSGGDEEAGPPDSLRVVSLVDRGVEQALTLDSEPAVQADLFQTLGGIYQKLGRLERADSLLQLSLERKRRLYGEDHREVASSLIELAGLRSDQAKFDEAEKMIRQALVITKRIAPPEDPINIRGLDVLGHIFVEHGDYDSAVVVLESVVALRSRTAPGSADLAGSLYELANVHFYAGHYAVSDSLNHRVIGLYRALYGERHPTISGALINLGAAQYEQGHYPEAERYYRQAIDITRGWYGNDHPILAANLTMLARPLLFQQRYDEANQLLQQALAIRERVYGKDHPAVASSLNELATIALGRERYDEAEADYKRITQIYRQAYNNKHYYIAIALSNLASVYVARKDYARAEQLYREALVMYDRTLEPTNINVGIAHIKLGRALLRQRRFKEAEKETRTGYDIVSKQADPNMNFLVNARKDLIAAYDSLGRSAEAARWRQIAEKASQ